MPALFFLLVVPVILVVVFQPLIQERRAAAGICNHNSSRTEFLFRLPDTPARAEELLQADCVQDFPRTRYRAPNLTFIDANIELTYRTSYLTDGTHAYLHLQSLRPIPNYIAHKITPCLTQKLSAAPAEITLLPHLHPTA